MTVNELLDKLKNVPEINIHDERSLKDGTRVLIFSTTFPFPKVGGAWYPIVVKSDDDEIAPETIEAMLRHLWMFQSNII